MIIVSTTKLPTGNVQAIGRDEHGRTHSVVVKPPFTSTADILVALQLAADTRSLPGEGV